MKAIKFIFAIFLLSTLAISCSATSVSDDDELYNVEEQAISLTGGEGTAEIMRSRE